MQTTASNRCSTPRFGSVATVKVCLPGACESSREQDATAAGSASTAVKVAPPWAKTGRLPPGPQTITRKPPSGGKKPRGAKTRRKVADPANGGEASGNVKAGG